MKNQPNDPIEAKLQRILTGRLNQLCREQNISLKELSQKSGVSLSTIRRIAKGKHCNVRVDIIIKFGRAFGITASQFVDENLLKTENED